MTYQSEVLADSPLAYWRLGDASGTTAADTSGNGRNATYSGSLTLGTAGLVAGDADTCVDFTGGKAQIASAAWMNVTAFTIEAIIVADDLTADRFIAARDLTGLNSQLSWNLQTTATGQAQIRLRTTSNYNVVSVSTLATGTTYHIAATYDGATLKLYVNGALDNSTAATGVMAVPGQPIAIGCRPDNLRTFDGRIDEVAVYGTALSSTRIAAHYSAASAPPPDQTIEPTLIASSGGMFGPTVLQPPVGTVLSRRIGRRLTASPQIRVGGVWLATVGAAGDLVVKHGRNGSKDATWSMALDRNERPACLTEDAPVEIYYGCELVWSGTLAAPDWNAGTFAAIGSSREGEGAQCLTGAGVVTSKPNTAINAAISRGVVSWTRVGDFGTADLSGVEGDASNSDPDIDSVNGLLGVWAIEEDSQWYVYPDRRLDIRPEDETEPKWFVLPGTVVLGVASDDITDRVFLRYRSSVDDYLRTASYPATTPVGGIERKASIVKRGRMSAARALIIATAMFNRLQAGRTGWTNGIDAHHGQIITKGGLVANLSLIRGGDTVRVLDHPDPRGVARHVDLVIDEVIWSPEENRVQLNPVGLAARTWESVMKQSRAVEMDGTGYSFETSY